MATANNPLPGVPKLYMTEAEYEEFMRRAFRDNPHRGNPQDHYQKTVGEMFGSMALEMLKGRDFQTLVVDNVELRVDLESKNENEKGRLFESKIYNDTIPVTKFGHATTLQSHEPAA